MTKRAWSGIAIAGVLLVGIFGAAAVAANSEPQPDAGGAPAALATPAPTPTPTPTYGADPAVAPTADAPVAPVAGSFGPENTAAALLATLPVKGKAPKSGYDRTGDFGSAWLDVDRNGCDTRNDILARDLTAIVRSGSCRILSGTLAEPYTGTRVAFVRGAATSSLVQIDHLVALSNAWQTGAQQLTQEQRVSLANDPLNLLAADGRANAQKGDGDAATWLPAAKSFRCTYVARQISVKVAYGLWVAPAERDAMARVLSTCPEQRGMASGAAPRAAVKPSPAASDPVTPEGVSYANCTAVRAAGAAPIRVGEPGYSGKLDRDGDGVGCE